MFKIHLLYAEIASADTVNTLALYICINIQIHVKRCLVYDKVVQAILDDRTHTKLCLVNILLLG